MLEELGGDPENGGLLNLGLPELRVFHLMTDPTILALSQGPSPSESFKDISRERCGSLWPRGAVANLCRALRVILCMTAAC